MRRVSRVSAAIPQSTRLMAAALAGDQAALAEVAASEDLVDLVIAHRLAPALVMRCSRAGIAGPGIEAWRRELVQSIGRHVLLDEAMGEVGQQLGQEGIAWAPLKGMDLASSGVYPEAEERVTSDLDILIGPADLATARRVLVDAGWGAVESGDLAEGFLHDEGYTWHATQANGVTLELHYRLWGTVPAELAQVMLERSRTAPDLGVTARRLQPMDEYLVAAVHTWVSPGRRPLAYFWDLHRLALAHVELGGDEVLAETRRWGLQLMVGLSSAIAAELWGDPLNRSVASVLGELRAPEAAAVAMACRGDLERFPLHLLALARLLARRPSRSGWRAPVRRLWPHPATVAQMTPGHWPAPLRRVVLTARMLGLTRLARAVEKRMAGSDSG